MGQVDSFFQSLPTAPALHVIIEPHPDVLQHMRDTGWYEKKGVKILEGKWQDFIESGSESDVLLDAGGFDAVYTDTFSEDYDGETTRLAYMYVRLVNDPRPDLYRFFQHLPRLLAGPDARFSFFNGLGATSECRAGCTGSTRRAIRRTHDTCIADALFYDVYVHLSEIHLEEVGLEVRWDELDVAATKGEDRWGKTREYFGLRLYRLPIGHMRPRASVQEDKK